MPEGEGQEPANPTPNTDPTTQDPQKQPEPTSQDPQNDPKTGTEEPFDRDRAMRTIQTLRPFEKQAKDLAKKVADYEKREQDRKRAELTELEREKAEKADLAKQLEAERTASRDSRNRLMVQVEASKHGIIDPDAAVRLLDWSQIELDDTGHPKDIGAALQALAEQRPYLVDKTPPHVNPTNPATRSQQQPTKRVYTTAELSNYEFYRDNEKDINLAIKEGRIKG